MVSILATPVTDTYGCERRHLFLSWHLDRVSVDARGHSDGSQCWQIRTSRSQQLPVGPSRDDHVSISITSAILPPPFDYLPLVRNTPAPFTSTPPHVPSPTTTLFWASHTCVRRCQPRVLLTDVRIDNLCPLIMTVRSRARRYLTVRLIAISREFDGMFRVPLPPLAKGNQSPKISFEWREFQIQAFMVFWR